MNQAWRLDVGCVATDCTLNLDTALGQPVSLLTRLADGSEHTRTGLLLGVQDAESDGSLARYRLQIGPWLAELAHTRRSQVWQERSVVEIIDSIFTHYSLASWRWAPCVPPHLAVSPQGADGLRSLCIQYRESDLAFVQRLLAEEGLNFRIEPDLEAPAGHSLVIFADSTSTEACPEVWQERSVVEIIDSIFTHYPLASWRWAPCVAPHLAVSPQGADGLRSLCTQYRESDLAFVQRLLAEEGLNFRIEPDLEAPAGHSLVIFADSTSTEACPENVCSLLGGGVAYHRAESVEAQDAIQAFGGMRQLPVAETVALGWDYRAKATVAGSTPTASAYGGPHAPRLQAVDAAGAYAFGSSAAAQRATELHQQAHEARAKRWLGRSTVRSFASGQRFSLRGSMLDTLDGLTSATPQPKTFLLTQVHAAGVNNLPKDLVRGLQAALAPHGPQPWQPPQPDLWAAGPDQLPQWVPPELRQQARERGYANHFEASRVAIPWRPLLQDGSGARLNPRPTGPGLMTATVVGPDGNTQASGADELHMDALGRVRIQFPFHRHAAQSGSALPNTSASSTWVRVAQSAAGPGMGTQFIPRIGQEVIVTFLDNDIDRPIVTGTLYNGQGEGGHAPSPGGVNQDSDTSVFAHSADHQPSAQGNLMGAGHSPAWHGASPHSHTAGGQANSAALSGFKTKEFGGQGFNQLVFDDTPQQLRTQLATSQHASQLNLGHLVHQADNHRGSFRGLGFELRTDAYGAIRAGQGVLISSYGLPEQEPAGDNTAGMALAKQLLTLGQSFSQAAATHQAVKLAGNEGTSGAKQSSLSTEHAPFNALHTALSGLVGQTWEQAQGDAASITGAANKAQALPHTTAPVIAISARAGLVQTAGQDHHAAAAETLTLAAGQHSSAATGGALRIHSGQAIGMLGGAIQPGSEAAGTGISLIAAQGDLSLQAQASTLQVAAKGRVNIQSANSHIDWAAAKKISLTTAGGANITLEGGNITVQCPGTMTVKASVRKFGGPSRVNYALPELPAEKMFAASFVVRDDLGKVQAGQHYLMTLPSGDVRLGITDAAGQTLEAYSNAEAPVELTLLGSEQWAQENVNASHQEMDKYWNESEPS
ncbi:MAG: hypothetical protein C4K60_07905 [Ideonella sp. MAG2]|nr:MAG: hypothetical protein C4K60_07905 [Ideonella sp. MAG2]